MKQLRRMSILVWGLQLLLLVLALFLVVWLVPDTGGKPSQEMQSSETEADEGSNMSENDENGMDTNEDRDLRSDGNTDQEDMDSRSGLGKVDEDTSERASSVKGSKRRNRRKPSGEKEVQAKIGENTAYIPPTIWLATDLHYQSPHMTDFQAAFDTYTMGNDGTIVPYLDEITDAFLEEVRAERPSALILSGDLSQNGEKANHQALAGKLERVQEAGIPVLVIPGNHDINHPWAATYFEDQVSPAEGTSSEEFYQIYRQFGYDQAASRASDSLSYVYHLDEKYWLMMLDSCMCEPVHETGGKLSAGTVAWMKTQLEEAKKQGVTVIPVSHHNLLDESTLYPEECTIENSKEVTALLEEYGVPVYLSGHMHLQRIKKHTSALTAPGGYGIHEIVTSPLTMWPCQYSVLDWQEDGGLSYHTEKVDVAGWAQRYGEEDENLLDFENYSYHFMEDIISDQTFRGLASASKEIKEEMAKLYADANRDYCSGTKIDVSKVKKSEAYQYWIRYSGNDFWLARLQAILHDARTNNTALELKAGVDFPLPGETIERSESGEDAGADAGSPAEEIQKKEQAASKTE